MKRRISFSRFGEGILLAISLLGCSKLNERIDNVSSRVDDIENSQSGTSQDGGVQSIVFVPEYSDGNARVYYSTKEDGSFTPEKMILRFAVTPAEFADKLAASYKSSLNLEATYTRTKAVAVGDDVSIPVLEASASDGKLTVTASAEALDQAFFRKELAASVRLIASLDGISKSSEYVPMIPAVDADSETGENLNIPDIYFKAYLVDNFDVNGDGEISVDEALAVKEINIASSSLPIRSLSGIEYFTKLETLDCSGSKIAVIDLSFNAALRRLNCSNNSLTELDLSEKLYLIDVDCSGNKINKLLLSNACGLKNLNCSKNAIVEINLHDSQFLSKLECYSNPVKELILDNNVELEHLFFQSETTDAIEENAIKISAMSSLESLALSGDYTDVIVSGCESLKTLDITQLPGLEKLNASNCSLTTINLSNNTKLSELDVSKNAITAIVGIENCTNLVTVYCAGNSITGLDLHTLTQLRTLICSLNPVERLILDNCSKLSLLSVNPAVNAISGSSISFSDYSQAASFDFSIRNTPFTSFSFTDSPGVKSLTFDGDFTTVDISGNAAITSVNVSLLADLTNLNASGLSISELDLTAITHLKTLDVTDNPNLTRVICPSLSWFSTIRHDEDYFCQYVDVNEDVVGGAVEIDGVVWAGKNVESTLDNSFGKEYAFAEAQKACPEGWKTPTRTELESLSKNYSSVVTVNGMQGRWFSGSKTYSSSVPAVFLPYMKGSSYGYYWSSTEGLSNNAYSLSFYSSGVRMGDNGRSNAYSVRCLKN